jgi:hypothetical protein
MLLALDPVEIPRAGLTDLIGRNLREGASLLVSESPTGEFAVQRLEPGRMVLTADAGTAPGVYLISVRNPDGQQSNLLPLRVTDAPANIAFRRGDANADGRLDIADAVFVLAYLFTGGDTPGCSKAADADDSGDLDVTDPVYLLGFLFLGGPAPASPFPGCGPDPRPDELTCESFAPCEGG